MVVWQIESGSFDCQPDPQSHGYQGLFKPGGLFEIIWVLFEIICFGMHGIIWNAALFQLFGLFMGYCRIFVTVDYLWISCFWIFQIIWNSDYLRLLFIIGLFEDDLNLGLFEIIGGLFVLDYLKIFEILIVWDCLLSDYLRFWVDYLWIICSGLLDYLWIICSGLCPRLDLPAGAAACCLAPGSD